MHYETLQFLRYVPPDVTSAISIDLEDGYHHFCLHPAIRQYFSFFIDHEYWECIGLPFGWSLSPAIFTRLLGPVITLLARLSFFAHLHGVCIF